MTVTYFLFRHGETDWNAQQRFQGHIDIELNNKGRQQARDLIEPLAPLRLDLILSSDLKRAAETGRIVADSLGIPIHTDPRLREAFLGQAQGLTLEEIRTRFGVELAQRWRSTRLSDADIQYPGGETGRAVMTRALAALESVVSLKPQVRCVGVACHGGVIRRVLQAVLADEHDPVPIPNGVIYEITFNPARSPEERWEADSEKHARWLHRARSLENQKR